VAEEMSFRTLTDFEGVATRLTGERLQHILGRPEMAGLERSIAETLKSPETVMQSLSDPEARLYYRYYVGTTVGDKFLAVVVKRGKAEAFVLTAYLTDRVKKGERIWPRRP
jgi:hypothetical protein